MRANESHGATLPQFLSSLLLLWDDFTAMSSLDKNRIPIQCQRMRATEDGGCDTAAKTTKTTKATKAKTTTTTITTTTTTTTITTTNICLCVSVRG